MPLWVTAFDELPCRYRGIHRLPKRRDLRGALVSGAGQDERQSPRLMPTSSTFTSSGKEKLSERSLGFSGLKNDALEAAGLSGVGDVVMGADWGICWVAA